MTGQKLIRFRLRTLFCVVAIGAVLSEIGRWASSGQESPFLVGLLVFSYGGLAAILCHAMTGVLFILATRSAVSPRFEARLASIVCALVWLTIVILLTYMWPPVCALFTVAVATLMTLIIKGHWKLEQGSSPERTIERLKRTKGEMAKILYSDKSDGDHCG